MRTRRFFYYGKFGVLGIVALAAFTLVVMWLWNWLVPELFKGPVVNYWQTLGLLVLSKIIFTGLGGKCNQKHDHHWKRRSREDWKRKFKEKMNGISDQQEQTEGEPTT